MTRRFLILRALRAFVVLFLGWAVSLFSVGLLPAAPAQEQVVKRPNILLAIADDWSFGHASAYGCSWIKTPGFDRVAREGLLFTRAYTPNAKCAPSRACLLTGRNSWQLEAACNHICFFPPKFKTYAERSRSTAISWARRRRPAGRANDEGPAPANGGKGIRAT
jgi:hypothetical protein